MAGIRDDVRTEQEETLEKEMHVFIASKEKTAEESFQLTVRERKDADPSFDSKTELMTFEHQKVKRKEQFEKEFHAKSGEVNFEVKGKKGLSRAWMRLLLTLELFAAYCRECL